MSKLKDIKDDVERMSNLIKAWEETDSSIEQKEYTRGFKAANQNIKAILEE